VTNLFGADAFVQWV